MRPLTILIFAVALLQAADFKLPASCNLPPALNPVDSFSSCGNTGADKTGKSISLTIPKGREGNAKNTFCADMSHPVSVDIQFLRDMQTAVDNLLRKKFKTLFAQSPLKATEALLKDDRTGLQTFTVHGKTAGEGTVVRIVAMMHDAHVSDCRQGGHGEDVNCSRLGLSQNDFHLPLMDPASPGDTDECNSVAAEISPHFRPTAWSTIDLKTPTKNPVRITGPLFYDDSHQPCKPDKNGKMSGSPPRSSVWEIHPIYEVEVCSNTDAASCDIDGTDVWTPYTKWIETHAADTTASGERARDECPAGTPPAKGKKK